MWRDQRCGLTLEKQKISPFRWRLIMALVFLLASALIYRLFCLQVKDTDRYVALAASQQQTFSRLQPERGKIFFTETINNQEKLYSAATNKRLAVLFAVPKEITDPRALAEKFYEFFDRPVLEQELINIKASSSEIATSTKEGIITNYLKRFDKPGDVYEPLENKKVDTETLLKLFAVLGSASSTAINISDLQIKDDRVFFKEVEGRAARELKIPGIGLDWGNFRYYPEKEIGAHLLGFVSYVDGEGHGRYGLEEFFDKELTGEYGFLKSEKGGASGAIIVNDREYMQPINGADLILTIDRNVEFFACEKLQAAVTKHGASGGSVIVIEPKTGAIIAMCSLPSFDPNDYKNISDIAYYNNPTLLYQYEPGSVFKTITMSVALDQEKVSPATTYKDEGQIMIKGWYKPISNSDFSTHGPHGIVDMNTVLEYSLNTGAIFAMNQVGAKTFADYVKNYGFGEKTGIELGAESGGNISQLLSKKIKEIDAATASFGQGIASTPLQMVMSYQALANQGVLMKPYIVKAIVRGSQREDILPKQIRQVVSAKTAATISAMLVNVVERGHAKGGQIKGYYVGGKTGTAQVAEGGGYSSDKYIHTFVGSAPIENPAFVMLTKIDDPKDVMYAEGSVVPLWQEIADFMLKYYQVPKTRKDS